MKALLCCVTAIGLTLGFAQPSQAIEPSRIVAASWSGVYVGISAGYGQSNNSAKWSSEGPPGGITATSFFLNGVFENSVDATNRPHYQDLVQRGFVGGGLIGYNLRIAKSWLASVETDLQYSDFESSASNTGLVNGALLFSADSRQALKTFGTFRGRVGMLSPDERVLAYVTGGFAYGISRLSASVNNLSDTTITVIAPGSLLACFARSTCLNGVDSVLQFGWTAGGGLEWLVWDKARLRVEYLHVDLGQHLLTLRPSVAASTSFAEVRFRTAFDVVRAALVWGF